MQDLQVQEHTGGDGNGVHQLLGDFSKHIYPQRDNRDNANVFSSSWFQ